MMPELAVLGRQAGRAEPGDESLGGRAGGSGHSDRERGVPPVLHVREAAKKRGLPGHTGRAGRR